LPEAAGDDGLRDGFTTVGEVESDGTSVIAEVRNRRGGNRSSSLLGYSTSYARLGVWTAENNPAACRCSARGRDARCPQAAGETDAATCTRTSHIGPGRFAGFHIL